MGGISLNNLNPFTGFGLLDTGLEHASAKDLQQRGHDFDREMWDKQSAFAVEQFGRESDFTAGESKKQFERNKILQDLQFQYDLKGMRLGPKAMVTGLKDAGLNPILAATGGFRGPTPNVGLPSQGQASAKATAGGPSRGGSPAGARSNVALAKKYGTLIESEVQLNSAKAVSELARAGVQDRTKDILEPVAKLMQAISGALEQAKVDRKTTTRVWEWLMSELPREPAKMTEEEKDKMLEEAKRKFPVLKGVKDSQRKIFDFK
jgi:hypothetical protein